MRRLKAAESAVRALTLQVVQLGGQPIADLEDDDVIPVDASSSLRPHGTAQEHASATPTKTDKKDAEQMESVGCTNQDADIQLELNRLRIDTANATAGEEAARSELRYLQDSFMTLQVKSHSCLLGVQSAAMLVNLRSDCNRKSHLPAPSNASRVNILGRKICFWPWKSSSSKQPWGNSQQKLLQSR